MGGAVRKFKFYNEWKYIYSQYFHLNNRAESIVDGNVYAKNVYVGKSANSFLSTENRATFNKNVIVNNDLALNATNSPIEKSLWY